MALNNMHKVLIARTADVIATEGLDKTTTKAIAVGSGINEAYIYRNFFDKEDLLSKTFDALDEELLAETLERISVMYMTELEFDLRCRIFFEGVWNFMIGNKNKCLAFIRYYYSPYYKRNSAVKHKQRFWVLVEKLKEAFIEEADVWMILNHILHVMLAFAVMVHNEQMPSEDNYSEHVFRVIYESIKQYFN